MWIKADSIEVCYGGVTYLDAETGKWLWLWRVGDNPDETKWLFSGEHIWDVNLAPFDFVFIRDRLMENCNLGYTGD